MSLAERLLFSPTISFIILVLACHKTPIQASPAPNLYVIALQWGISFCRQSGVVCRRQVLQNFTIHGLWRYDQDNGAMLPPYTAVIDLRSNRVRSQVQRIPGINENWPNLLAGESNIIFWNRQWRKHGQWLSLPPEQYFRKANHLMKQIENLIGRRSLAQFFKDKGLPPDEIKRYLADYFLSRIMVETGFIGQMQCNVNRDGVSQLAEIRFCFDANWDLADCPRHNQLRNPMKKSGTQKYKPQGNPQSSFHIGNCPKNQQILFPALIPASPPPPPPPPPPRASPPKPAELQPPLPAPPKNPLITSFPNSQILSYAAVVKGLQFLPGSSASRTNAKSRRAWQNFPKLLRILAGGRGALRTLRGTARQKKGRVMTLIDLFSTLLFSFTDVENGVSELLQEIVLISSLLLLH